MKKSPMLDALRQKKAGALDIHILIGDPESAEMEGGEELMENENMAMEDSKEEERALGLAPEGSLPEEEGEVVADEEAGVAPAMMDPKELDRMMLESGLAMGKKNPRFAGK